MEPGDSAARSRDFYRRLGPTGLAIRTKPEWDAGIVDALVALLPPSGRVLDVGCGYGRIAIPLARRGYAVTGVDVAPNLLRAARRESARLGLAIPFDRGSMTALPYGDGSFDAVVSLWSAFYELTAEAEQVAALAEMRRVLALDGVGVIEGPIPPASTPDGRIVTEIVAGLRMEQFAHDAETLGRLAAAVGLPWWRVSVQTWALQERQVFLFGRGDGQPSTATLRR